MTRIAGSAALVIALAAGVVAYFIARPSAPVAGAPLASPPVTVVPVGDGMLEFPSGLVVDAGAIAAPNALTFSFPIRNVGESSVELKRIQLMNPCCGPVKLLPRLEVLAPKASSSLDFRWETSDRPGRNRGIAAVGYRSADGVLRRLVEIECAYTLNDHCLARWSLPDVDFDEVWYGGDGPTRRVEFVVQHEGPSPRDEEPQFQCERYELEAMVLSREASTGKFDLAATVYALDLRLTGHRRWLGEGKAEIVAKGPDFRVPLRVRWRSAPNVVVWPEGSIVLLKRPDSTVLARVQVRSFTGEPPVVDEIKSPPGVRCVVARQPHVEHGVWIELHRTGEGDSQGVLSFNVSAGGRKAEMHRLHCRPFKLK